MSKYGSSTVSIFIEGSPGGTSYDVSQYIDTLGGQKITAITEPSHTFGDSWEEHIPVGLSKGEPFDFEGQFDNVATSGPHAIFKDVDDGTTDDTRAMVVGFGAVAYRHFDIRLASYEVIASNGKITRYKCNALPTGTVTWTTSTS